MIYCFFSCRCDLIRTKIDCLQIGELVTVLSQSCQSCICDLIAIKIDCLQIGELVTILSQSCQSCICDLIVTKIDCLQIEELVTVLCFFYKLLLSYSFPFHLQVNALLYDNLLLTFRWRILFRTLS